MSTKGSAIGLRLDCGALALLSWLGSLSRYSWGKRWQDRAVEARLLGKWFSSENKKRVCFLLSKVFCPYVQILHSLRTWMPTGWTLALWSCSSPCTYLECDILEFWARLFLSQQTGKMFQAWNRCFPLPETNTEEIFRSPAPGLSAQILFLGPQRCDVLSPQLAPKGAAQNSPVASSRDASRAPAVPGELCFLSEGTHTAILVPPWAQENSILDLGQFSLCVCVCVCVCVCSYGGVGLGWGDLNTSPH